MDAMTRYKAWLQAPWLDDASREDLIAIGEAPAEIEDRFYTEMEFGTAGMRGVLGVGENRMNVYTVRRAAQGLASTIGEAGEEAMRRGVAIAYDSRHFSDVFARETAGVLCANGINVYLYESLRPVPQLSFTLRELGCISGVVITASHNPAVYNGFKVYWEDGGQVPPEPVAKILAHIRSIDDYGSIGRMDLNEAKTRGLLRMIGRELDDKYVGRVKQLALQPGLLHEQPLGVVYTPLHGSGNVPVRRVLSELGVRSLRVVPEQEMPNGDFPTVSAPNPEVPDAFALALELAKKVDADLILGTDPDCDRIGIMAKSGDGYALFNGNQIGCILLEYVLSTKAAQGALPGNGMVIKTIVSTELAGKICEAYGVEIMSVLTGFKFIAEQIENWERTREHEFVFGFEESYGYLMGTFVRDKDAVIAAMLAAEAAAHYMKQGKTLHDVLQDVYNKYGFFEEEVISITLPGKDGMQKMGRIMAALRENPPKEFAGVDVAAVRDYQSSLRTDAAGQSEKLTLPVSDVLYYEMADGAKVVIRPSGTEPKIKLYFGVGADTVDAAKARVAAYKQSVCLVIDAI